MSNCTKQAGDGSMFQKFAATAFVAIFWLAVGLFAPSYVLVGCLPKDWAVEPYTHWWTFPAVVTGGIWYVGAAALGVYVASLIWRR